jgi:photosystem II stability/assembly factor-like uncharacterized protein
MFFGKAKALFCLAALPAMMRRVIKSERPTEYIIMRRLFIFALCLWGCSSQPIFGVIGIPEGQLYAVGWMGSTLSSSDGGNTWVDQENPTEETLHAITQDLEGTRYAAGEKGILLWARPNQKWDYAPTPNLKAFLMGVFADERGVFVVGELGTILYSKDRGQTWKTKNIGKSWLRDIKGDAKGLYAVGLQGAFLCSFDAGESWIEAKTNTTEALYGVWGDGLGNLYAVGSNGAIVRTSDRCQTFQQTPSGTDAALYEIVGRTPSELYAVGARGLILRSVDQGKSWLTVESNTTQELYAIAQYKGKWLAFGANRTTATIATLPQK